MELTREETEGKLAVSREGLIQLEEALSLGTKRLMEIMEEVGKVQARQHQIRILIFRQRAEIKKWETILQGMPQELNPVSDLESQTPF